MDNGYIQYWMSLWPRLLVAIGAIFALLVFVRQRAKGKQPDSAARRPASMVPKLEISTIPVTGGKRPSEPEPLPDLQKPTQNAIEVAEADPLAEAAVYLEFGYLDHAAQVLRGYADGAGGGNREVLRKLLQIYLQLGYIDDYADILERLWEAAEDPDFVQSAMLSGLEIDIDNLQLRVLADSHLGLGPERLNKLLGADVVWEEDHNPVDDSEPALAATAVADPDLSQLNQGGGSRPPRLVLRLVEGGVRLTSSFSTEEKAMLRVFSHPAHEARLHRTEARMHRAAGDLDAAAEALRRAIAVYPRALVNFAELLWVFHRRKRLDDFVHALWHLYSVLNGAGRALRERFLGMGLALGQHQILEALLQATDRQQIEEIGRQFGLLPAEKNATRKLQLIDASRYEPDDQATESAADVHEEVNAYLEFGQLDQAIELLEATIVNDPDDPRFYPTLLDLYDRMDELDRFTALSAKIKRLIQRPPEEVVPMMISLQQRLQHRQQRGRRAGE